MGRSDGSMACSETPAMGPGGRRPQRTGQHLFFGSYMKSRCSRRRPASDSHGKRCFRLLYGCFLRLYWPTSGSWEKPCGVGRGES